MEFKELFSKATAGQTPFPYQSRLGELPWPDVLNVPTGLGKTAAVTLAWVYRRCELRDPRTPRRLVWCLPMRVLVEQTKKNVENWLDRLGLLGAPGEVGKVSVHLLMGGAEDVRKAQWTEHPESDVILIGTQDMLLSRALMRGYGMSRYQWPVHFALLHNDAFWVFDEVQLMGAGLQTSAQLEAFRRTLPLGANARSLWMSATLNKDWLATVDFRSHIENLSVLELADAERACDTVRERREAVKRLHRAEVSLTEDNAKGGAAAYVKALAEELLAKHQHGTQSVVILNTVERAQAMFEALEKSRPGIALLVHARFRQKERAKINNALMTSPSAGGDGRIVVATQAIEAGIDITSRVLFTELAPWSSLVQRFGRCNRYGEWNHAGGADVFWIDVGDELTRPYTSTDLASARGKLKELDSASPAHLPTTDEAAPLVPVLRRRDFLDLFNTDPDLSGFDTDIAPYIRDADDLDVQVFWRTKPEPDHPQPIRDEICRASLSQLKRYLDRRKGELAAWRWDALDGKWVSFRDNARPGLVLMLDAALGGYDERSGFLPEQTKHAVAVLMEPEPDAAVESYGGDHLSRQNRPVELIAHLKHMEHEVRALSATLGLGLREVEAMTRAGRWHDVGKAHEVFRATMSACEEMTRAQGLWAKSPCKGRHGRLHFRHELASMLAWLIHCSEEPDANLVAYLIAAHHGKVRMALRAMPDEKPPKDTKRRFARGIWEGDFLPALELHGETMPETELRLDLMEIGESAMGASWTERTQRLLEDYGPFRLAWLETLVRIADWRASEKEQEEQA